ncbi:MAG: glycosyltransferase family 2 protein [Pseudomonadota bacterium]
MSSAPDVSVIMAAWTAADFIAPAIQSVLAQDHVDLELIVVDDASGDTTVQAAREAGAGDPRLKVERLDVNGGPSAARNRAMDLATGRYIAVVDCDDSLEPGRLSALVAFADDTGADIVADNMNRVDTLGAPGAEGVAFLAQAELEQPLRISLADYLDPATEARFGENLGYLKPLFRSQTLQRLAMRYDTSLRNSEDFYLVASLLAEGADMRLHPMLGYNYLVRPGSISHRLNPALTGAILAANDAFAAKYSEAFDADARLAQAKRTSGLQNMHSFECVVDALKARRPARILSALAHRPAAVPHVAARLAGIATAKLRGNAAP